MFSRSVWFASCRGSEAGDLIIFQAHQRCFSFPTESFRLSGSKAMACRTMVGWLIGNLLLGSQLTWILRPFVGSPFLPVEFLRPNAMEGNLFEALFYHTKHLFS